MKFKEKLAKEGSEKVKRVLRNVTGNNHTQLEGNGTDCAHAGPRSTGHDYYNAG